MNDTTIDTVSALPGTVKHYDQHVIVCMGHRNWEPKVENGDPFVAALTCALKSAEGIGFAKITACDAPPTAEGTYDVMVFPANRKFVELTEAEIPALLAALRGQSDVGINFVTLKKPVWLVCTHASRDVRCGEQGEQLFFALDEFLQAETRRDAVELWHSSHVGQHKFAGNMICYPRGDWYGRVGAADAADIIHAELDTGKPLARLWRGRIGLPPSEQIQLFDAGLA